MQDPDSFHYSQKLRLSGFQTPYLLIPRKYLTVSSVAGLYFRFAHPIILHVPLSLRAPQQSIFLAKYIHHIHYTHARQENAKCLLFRYGLL